MRIKRRFRFQSGALPQKSRSLPLPVLTVSKRDLLLLRQSLNQIDYVAPIGARKRQNLVEGP
jgi:hypothetical protein